MTVDCSSLSCTTIAAPAELVSPECPLEQQLPPRVLQASPLDVYPHTFLPHINTRKLPSPPDGDSASEYSFPRCVSPDRYFSLFPSWRLGIHLHGQHEMRPVDLAYFRPDADVCKEIFLIVYTEQPEPRDRHWGIRWVVSARSNPDRLANRAARCLELYAHVRSKHLVNWGPITQQHHLYVAHQISSISLGVLTLEQRRQLEAIAWNVPICLPDGEWNCQNWVCAVLVIAVARGILDGGRVRSVLDRALQKEIRSDSSPFERRKSSDVASL
ncbi:hypothetical protein EV121DRAFT_260689 [Schizophyllum commune]